MPNASRPSPAARRAPGVIPWRGAGALLVTGGALALLLSFRTLDGDPSAAVVPVPADSFDPAVATAPAPPPDPTPTATPKVVLGPPAPGHVEATPSAMPAPTEAAIGVGVGPAVGSATPAATSTPGAKTVAATVKGQAMRTPYGNVQVEVTVKDGRIMGITALQLPSDARYSRRISEVAEPMLREDALSLQSAHIHVLSGATYTSEGYARSLQSALDGAGL